MAMQAEELRVIGGNLKSLASELRGGQIELKLAAELANIYGKELKAQQLILAERIFEKQAGQPMPPRVGIEQMVALPEKHN